MERILICCNIERDPEMQVTRDILDRLHGRGVWAKAFLPFGGEPPAEMDAQYLCSEPEEAIRGCDLLLCLGGDGTMLHLSKLAARNGVPMLGINLGKVGFITGLELEELDRLDDVLSGDYVIENRMMLDVEVLRGDHSVYRGFGLNEALVTRMNPAHAIHLTAYGDNQKISDYSGDGIIIATPTGSTAYSMAAGGPIVEPTAENLILTPVCAHSLTAKAYVLAGDRRTSVKVIRSEDGILLVDGEESFPLQVGDLVYVKKSDYVTKLVKVRSPSFYEIVKNKLNV